MDLAVSPLSLVDVWFVLDFVRHHTLSITGEKKTKYTQTLRQFHKVGLQAAEL